MARPAKPVALNSKHLTKQEYSERERLETKIRGDKTKIICPSDLSPDQKKIFKRIVKELGNSDILGSLDTYLLRQTAIAIDRLQAIEAMINEDSSLLFNAKLMASKEKYSKEFFRCCNELGLSPQSRAKFANLLATKTEDPLLAALAADDDDDDED